LSFPSILQSGIICTRLGKSKGLIMERIQAEGPDSGWFCGCHEEDHDHNSVSELRCVSLYEAAVRYTPQIVSYLALPAGVMISVTDDRPDILQNGKSLPFKRSSYLAARHPGP
jgi:hypothetical protein